MTEKESRGMGSTSMRRGEPNPDHSHKAKHMVPLFKRIRRLHFSDTYPAAAGVGSSVPAPAGLTAPVFTWSDLREIADFPGPPASSSVGRFSVTHKLVCFWKILRHMTSSSKKKQRKRKAAVDAAALAEQIQIDEENAPINIQLRGIANILEDEDSKNYFVTMTPYNAKMWPQNLMNARQHMEFFKLHRIGPNEPPTIYFNNNGKALFRGLLERIKDLHLAKVAHGQISLDSILVIPYLSHKIVKSIQVKDCRRLQGEGNMQQDYNQLLAVLFEMLPDENYSDDIRSFVLQATQLLAEPLTNITLPRHITDYMLTRCHPALWTSQKKFDVVLYFYNLQKTNPRWKALLRGCLRNEPNIETIIEQSVYLTEAQKHFYAKGFNDASCFNLDTKGLRPVRYMRSVLVHQLDQTYGSDKTRQLRWDMANQMCELFPDLLFNIVKASLASLNQNDASLTGLFLRWE